MDVHIADRQKSFSSNRDRPQGSDLEAAPRAKTITRIELLDAVYRVCPKLSRAEAREILNMTIEEIAGALAQGERVEIRSFGSFYVRSKSERVGRNPRNGEPAPIAARRVARFRPSARLIQRVSEEKKS